MDTTGLKACSFAKVNAGGKAACPTASKAGTGSADALLNPYAADPGADQVRRDRLQRRQAQLDGRGDAAHAVPRAAPASTRQGRQYLNFHLSSAAPEVDQAITGVITPLSNRTYGQKLTIDIAPNLQQPASNVYSSLQSLEDERRAEDQQEAADQPHGLPEGPRAPVPAAAHLHAEPDAAGHHHGHGRRRRALLRLSPHHI